MVRKEQIEKGLANYLDSEFMPNVHTTKWKEVIVGTAASIMVKRVGGVVESLKDNKMLCALCIFNADGEIDIDLLASEAKKQMPQEGMVIPVPVLGDVKLYPSDLDTLYRMIVGAV